MPDDHDQTRPNVALDVVLDTCCLVNLAAIDGTLACLSSFELTWYVPAAVHAEGIFIRRAPDSRDVQQIDLSEAMSTGTVTVCAPEGEEEHALYIEMALSLDDGEAMALAIAKYRNWKLATDDRKARVKARNAAVVVVTTPELVRRWAGKSGYSEPQIAEAIRRIEALARFKPADDSDPSRWWRKILAENPGA